MPVQPPRQRKRLHLIFPAQEQEYTSIAQPLHLCKLGFKTFVVLKHACTTSSTVKTALSDLPSTETWVHKCQRTSKVVETEFSMFLVPKHDWRTSTGPPQKWKRLDLIFPALKQALDNLSTCRNWILSDFTSTETGVNEHHTTSRVVEIVLVDILVTERCLYNLHGRENDFIWSSQHLNSSPQASHIPGHSWYWNTPVWHLHDLPDRKNDFIWSYQH